MHSNTLHTRECKPSWCMVWRMYFSVTAALNTSWGTPTGSPKAAGRVCIWMFSTNYRLDCRTWWTRKLLLKPAPVHTDLKSQWQQSDVPNQEPFMNKIHQGVTDQVQNLQLTYSNCRYQCPTKGDMQCEGEGRNFSLEFLALWYLR